MPIPVNIDAANAIDILALPYSNSQTVDDSGTTYAVWYKFTASVDGIYNIFGFGDLLVYKPFLTIYGPNSSVIEYFGIEELAPNIPARVPLTTGDEFFFRFTPDGNVSPADLTVKVTLFANQPYYDGSILVNDDAPGLPLAIVSPTTGEVLAYVNPFPSGEAGDTIQSSGLMLFESEEESFLELYDSSFALLTTVPFTGPGTRPLIRANNANNCWFIMETETSPNDLKKVNPDGSIADTWSISSVSPPTAMAVDNDEVYAYYAIPSSGGSGGIRRYNIDTDTDEGVFIAFLLGYAVNDIIILADDTILVQYSKSTELFVKRFDTSGALLDTYDFSSGYNGLLSHIQLSLNPLTFWSWSHEGGDNNDSYTYGGISRFREVLVSNGSIVTNITTPEYETGIYTGEASATPPLSGISQSCPFLLLTESTPPPTGGTIVVAKVQVGGVATEFNFTTTDLTPSSFSLSNSEFQSFTELLPGSSYGVAEDTTPGFTTTVEVSNGDPIDAIEIEGDEVVTVTFTNTAITPANELSGIYKLVPDKRNDTLWVSFDPEETEDVKIPDPFFKSALFGK